MFCFAEFGQALVFIKDGLAISKAYAKIEELLLVSQNTNTLIYTEQELDVHDFSLDLYHQCHNHQILRSPVILPNLQDSILQKCDIRCLCCRSGLVHHKLLRHSIPVQSSQLVLDNESTAEVHRSVRSLYWYRRGQQLPGHCHTLSAHQGGLGPSDAGVETHPSHFYLHTWRLVKKST